MNQNLHSPTKLTEFARNFEDEPESLFGRFVNKLQNVYNHSYNTVNDVPTTTSSASATNRSTFYEEATATESSPSSSASAGLTKPMPPNSLAVRAASETNSASSSSTTTSECTESLDKVDELPHEATEGRTMVNVLKRISSIISTKNNDLRNYKDTDLQRLWMPDAKAKECYDCSQKFSAFRRKHHCRLCGQIFCSKCCNQVVPGRIIMCSGELKVCNYCSKIVLSYLKSPNIAVDLHSDLQVLQENLTNKLETEENSVKANNTPVRTSQARKISSGYQEERFASHQAYSLSHDDRKNILQQSNSLIILQQEMRAALAGQNCGLELIDFLNNNNKSSNKTQAIAILGAMLAAGFLEPIVPDSEEVQFDENLHYRFVEVSKHVEQQAELFKHPARTSGEVTSPQFVPSDEPQPPKTIDASLSFQSIPNFELENSMRSTTTTSKLLESYCEHEDQLLMQLLRTCRLDLRWSKVLSPLCCRAANQFKPEFCTNELMDIRDYVNFKKVPGGKRHECSIVGGVVFSKNVAHKDMATRVDRPSILLLQCPIVYERIEGKFVSISTVLLQEKEYLRNVCSRIMCFKPNVVVVHKNVAGIAQDILRAHGITLVLDVKLSVMERLARTLQCDILTSIESNITMPKLGHCDAFYIRNFGDEAGGGGYKTLMFFEKLQNPGGYTCLLRGSNNKELARVKKVASFLVYARYNWRLEMSFLLDEFAQPLSPKPPIFDSKESSPKDDSAAQRPPLQRDSEVLEPELRATPTRSVRLALERKSEDKIQTVVSQNVSDFTDPLRSTDERLSATASSFMELAVETRYDNRFRNALTSTLLSVSPFLSFPLPYLETEQGRKCDLRRLFPTELYFSKQWSTCTSGNNNNNNNTTDRTADSAANKENEPLAEDVERKLNPPHPFLKLKITAPIDNRDIQSALAEFRASGGRYPKRQKMVKSLKHQNFVQQPQKSGHEEPIYKDALDVENHQRLPVLFCSFYLNPKSASSFCAPPTLLDMKFYGQHDIMLGQFLQRYCCRLSNICTLCNLPMLGHVRRYVHSMGCVQVFLGEDQTKSDPNRIFFTAWCSICNEMTPSVPLSDTAKCLSFAKYLEMRFHGHAYKKRALPAATSSRADGEEYQAADDHPKCAHSIHRDYIHYFSYRGVGAKFKYTPIEVWEISLPPLTLALRAPRHCDRYHVLEDFKNFSLKGHEVYTRIHERIADLATEDETSALVASLKTVLNQDQFIFKQHTEVINTLLTDTQANAYDISDAMLMTKRVLAESIELWGPRLVEIAVAQKWATKHQQQLQQQQQQQHTHDVSAAADVLQTGTDEVPTGQPADTLDNSLVDAAVATENATNSDSPSQGHSAAAVEKKTIKKLLNHLLPSTSQANMLQTPFGPQEHYTMPLGSIPVLVHDQDLSSIIAYSLTSNDYQRAINAISGPHAADVQTVRTSEVGSGGAAGGGGQTSPSTKRKSVESGPGETAEGENTAANTTADEERSKGKTANNCHLEIAFQDNQTHFGCKVYFAKDFDLMRARTLKPPKLGSLFKELHQSKKREELKVSQSRAGPELELVYPAQRIEAAVTPPNNNNNNSKEDTSPLHVDIEESRTALARSLCCSVQWDAQGGKSGSRFCKTQDDRFVLKEMSKTDVLIFENFAPNYFEYLSKCQQQDQPTLLAKIFGVFKVSIKKKDSFIEKTLLVMENLFFDCDISNKFDLKGSERNRLVNPSNHHGEIVLLDENLVQMSWSKPLYILSHSKAVLRDAINRDSSFLERNKVMDYSLLVGLNNKNNVLVLGIIDYIRTFTFDKKVESFVKQTGILGGNGKLPTVISPERYKQRFIDAMDRYFYTVPDRWEGLSKI